MKTSYFAQTAKTVSAWAIPAGLAVALLGTYQTNAVWASAALVASIIATAVLAKNESTQ